MKKNHLGPPEGGSCKENGDPKGQRESKSSLSLESSTMQLGTEVLDLVLSFVDRGYHLFIGTVCREWRNRYKIVATVKLAEPLESLRTPGATVCSAAFASAALVRLAYSCGLDLHSCSQRGQSC
jgi:hypothetical protein